MLRTDKRVPEPRVGERKVTKQLAGLVDGGFEEGQYEAALASLDQIRSPEYSPLPSVPVPFTFFDHSTLTSRVVVAWGVARCGRIGSFVSLHVEPTFDRRPV
jgi:hypothetical protein